ncbi:hypothetical protein ACFLSQ_03795 [Bacteroidota bacterium]
MKPLKIALLWHFHQPYYGFKGEFRLPWVRLHGVKDYWDLPELFHEFPDVKQTINLVPSLCMQIDDYVSGRMFDKVQKLTLIKAEELTDDNKQEILRLFFLCNHENMIKPYPRFSELFMLGRNIETALHTFDPQDWRDLQVWYNLTWFGYSSRERHAVKRLFDKGKNYTEEEKKVVLALQLDVLNCIRQQMTMLQSLGQLELSCTPMYHPILPLLCDSGAAKEAVPDCIMPEMIFRHPEDAVAQIENALNYYGNTIDYRPVGMWPSEGSLSNEVIDLMVNAGLKWTASDEEVLSATLGIKYDPIMKYFPVKYQSPSGDIAVLFRDHNLSDAIGFVYSRWDQHDAAADFCSRLRNIRGELINRFGEECLDHAVVPVILDGENCWEFYYQNGIHFQRELFRMLGASDDLITVTCTEATSPEHLNYFPAVRNIRSGSWINANFKIWIGHNEELAAWTMLEKARKKVYEMKEKVSEESFNKAMEEIYIAEGSDWFWWYGDEHNAENKPDFDMLFRWHISEVYKALGDEIPEDVNIPIGSRFTKQSLVQQRGDVQPVIDGKISDSEKWNDAGYFDAAASMSAMHQVGEILHRVWFASSNNRIIFRCDIVHELKSGDIVEFRFVNPEEFSIIINMNGFRLKSDKSIPMDYFEFANADIIEFGLSKNILGNLEDKLEFVIKTKTKMGEITYPRQGTITIDILY